MNLLAGALAGSTVEIETVVSPPVRVNVGEQITAGGGPGLLTRLLRPRVTVRAGDQVVLRIEPAGAPDPEIRAMLAAALLVAALMLVLAMSKR